MMKKVLLIICLTLIAVDYLNAQTLQLTSVEVFNKACNENVIFKENIDFLVKKNGLLTVKTTKGKIKFRDYLVEQEDPEMKMYETVGVNGQLGLALIEEIGLTNSRFILINLHNKKTLLLNALPIISLDGKYIISISQPEGDSYDGFEIFKLIGDTYQHIYKDDNTSYYFYQSSGKWCNNKLYVKMRDLVDSTDKIYRIEF
jgi:hypothetical protein